MQDATGAPGGSAALPHKPTSLAPVVPSEGSGAPMTPAEVKAAGSTTLASTTLVQAVQKSGRGPPPGFETACFKTAGQARVPPAAGSKAVGKGHLSIAPGCEAAAVSGGIANPSAFAATGRGRLPPQPGFEAAALPIKDGLYSRQTDLVPLPGLPSILYEPSTLVLSTLTGNTYK